MKKRGLAIGATFALLVSSGFLLGTGCTGTNVTYNESVTPRSGDGDGDGGGGGDLYDEESEEEFYDRYSEDRPEDMAPWVKPLSPETMENLVDFEEDWLSFERGPEILEEVEPMDILFHARETFLLARRVLEIEKEESLIIFQTEEATLEDIFLETDGE